MYLRIKSVPKVCDLYKPRNAKFISTCSENRVICLFNNELTIWVEELGRDSFVVRVNRDNEIFPINDFIPFHMEHDVRHDDKRILRKWQLNDLLQSIEFVSDLKNQSYLLPFDNNFDEDQVRKIRDAVSYRQGNYYRVAEDLGIREFDIRRMLCRYWREGEAYFEGRSSVSRMSCRFALERKKVAQILV